MKPIEYDGRPYVDARFYSLGNDITGVAVTTENDDDVYRYVLAGRDEDLNRLLSGIIDATVEQFGLPLDVYLRAEPDDEKARRRLVAFERHVEHSMLLTGHA
ncbi:hypothetical protein QF001_003740 [Paraburkholderia youngii]|uniref:hypothetical protein n=1 Tax=Paraburkholderia youngii TaxID=2782701 RepID=UPI003D21E27F